MTRRAIDVAYIIGLAGLYVLTARLGHAFNAVSGFASIVWLPAGVSLAALLLLGIRLWPGVFIGAVLANYINWNVLPLAGVMGIGATAEAIVGALLLRRARDFSATLGTVRSVVTLIVFASIVAAMIGATVGTGALYFGRIIATTDILRTWRLWWMGDMVGALVVTPVILVWSRAPRAAGRRHWVEAVAVSLAILGTVAMVFFGDTPAIPSLPSGMWEASALLVVLLWATLRFGPRGAATAMFCVSVAAIFGRLLGHGPLIQSGPASGLLSLQTFIAIVAATLLLLGAHVSALQHALAKARAAEEEAAKANRTKSEFLAVMSHELRTPLNAISGYAQLLKEGIHGPLNEKQQDDVERIQRNEKQLLAHLEEIFGYVSAERGDVNVSRQTVYLTEVFDAIEPLMRTEFDEHACTLDRAHVDADLAVAADPKALQRILVSLLSNGSKFCGERGTVTLDADREGEFVKISVRDSGPGISQDQIKRVFEPFFQGDKGFTRRSSGIGLGLTIARDLAQLMGGEITLESADTGTTASVLLPAA